MATITKHGLIIARGDKHAIIKPNGHVRILTSWMLLKIAEQLVEVIININRNQHSCISLIWVKCIFGQFGFSNGNYLLFFFGVHMVSSTPGEILYKNVKLSFRITEHVMHIIVECE